jgi:hypothetical protein
MGADVFTKNRERLREADAARKFFAGLMDHKELRDLLSDEHFSVDGTQIGAVRLGQDDWRACLANATGHQKARLQVHLDDGRLQSDKAAKARRGHRMNHRHPKTSQDPQ